MPEKKKGLAAKAKRRVSKYIADAMKEAEKASPEIKRFNELPKETQRMMVDEVKNTPR